jgi:membrane fusion protein (multidrug efflux system)
VRLGVLAAALALVLGGIYYYVFAGGTESTDDAFIEGRIIQISPKVASYVARVYVDDNQSAGRGAPLVDLDPRDFEAKLAQAQANLAACEAQASQLQVDAQRAERLARERALSRQERDAAVAKAKTAVAQLDQLRAAVRQAELDLSYTKIRAPEAGRVTRKSVEVGSYVQVGQALMAIVPQDYWVVANFKETQLTDIRPGQPVTVTVDAYPGHTFKGHVDSIQAGAGSAFSLLPPENATGNFVKVVQRVPVKIVFDEAPDPHFPLGPGMSVVPSVRVK